MKHYQRPLNAPKLPSPCGSNTAKSMMFAGQWRSTRRLYKTLLMRTKHKHFRSLIAPPIRTSAGGSLNLIDPLPSLAIAPLPRLESGIYTKRGDRYNVRMNTCKRCNNELTGKQLSYCSQRCSKLHLKSLWRKRNLDKIREYNKRYREKATDAYFIRGSKQRQSILNDMPVCQKCSADNDLQLCHIKPHWAGGTRQKYNMYVFCKSCHHKFDNALRGFWNE